MVERWEPKPRLEVVMPYIGGVLSVNDYKIRGRGGRPTNRTKTIVLIWMERLAGEVKDFKHNGSLVIELFGRFKDDRSTPDLANLHKVIGDAIRDGIGLDDKYFKFIDRGYDVDNSSPTLNITLTV